MKDETMSKKELLEELGELRRQVAALRSADIERTQLEEGRRIQREKYRAVVDSITARVWYFDMEGRVHRVNSTVVRDLGVRAEAIIGKTVYEVLSFDQAKKIEADNREIIGSGKPKLGTIEEYALSVGAKGWAQCDKIPYYDKKGEIAGVITFAYDITERKRTEDALLTSQLKLSEAMDLARIVYWDVHPETGEVHFQRSLLRLLRHHGRTGRRLSDVEGGVRQKVRASGRYAALSADSFKAPGKQATESLTMPSTASSAGTARCATSWRAYPQQGCRGPCYPVLRREPGRHRSKARRGSPGPENRFLEALVHSSCDGILVVDDQRRKVFQNQRYIELRKLPQEYRRRGG